MVPLFSDAGRRTITNLLGIAGPLAPGHPSGSQRVSPKRSWSTRGPAGGPATCWTAGQTHSADALPICPGPDPSSAAPV